MAHLASMALASAVVLSLVPACAADDRPWPPPVWPGGGVNTTSNRPEAIVLSAIRSNPFTAPYPITATWKDGAVVLSGKVGTSLLHTMVVRTAIDLGFPVRDELVIDTGEAHRVAWEQLARNSSAYADGVGGGVGFMAQPGTTPPYFVYPPPLFGRVDDPFFGFEPPLVSFPPASMIRNLEPGRAPQPPPRGPAAAGGAPNAAWNNAPVKGKLHLSVDVAGQVFLSGTVASEADKRTIEEEARNTPGVTRVYSELKVQPRRSETPPPPPRPFVPGPPQDEPPRQQEAPAPAPALAPAPAKPPAQPAARPAAPVRPAPADSARKRATGDLAFARDTQPLTLRVSQALARRPNLSSLPVAVQSSQEVVTLSGQVPSAYEAMLVYRTVQQTPGVGAIVDQLQFQVPDENHPNPLRQKGRPEDLEPYLVSQIRRHVGDLAHVDLLRVRGDAVEVRGTLQSDDDRDRVVAILRSMPLLREFRIEASFQVD